MKRKVQARAYELAIHKNITPEDTEDLQVFVCTVESDGYAEQILRGFLHSGYTVSIKEVTIEKEVDVPEAKAVFNVARQMEEALNSINLQNRRMLEEYVERMYRLAEERLELDTQAQAIPYSPSNHEIWRGY